MNKLATTLACAVALTGWQVFPGGALADTISGPNGTMSVPVVNMVGTWSGVADAASENGYFHNVSVTLVVQDEQTMTNPTSPGDPGYPTNSANTFFRGTITFAPPYGSGEALPIFAKLESGQLMNSATQQGLHGMWAGQGFVGCGMGMTMSMTNGMTMATLAGCMHFPGQDGTTPSMAWLDLRKN